MADSKHDMSVISSQPQKEHQHGDQPPSYTSQHDVQMTQPAPFGAPAGTQWMPSVHAIAGCPPGLEYLTQVDQLIIKQEVHLVEVFTGFEKNNKFRVYNSMGQQVYYIKEDTSCAQRQFCGNARGFTFHVTDNNNKEVLRFERDFKCCVGCCWCADNLSCSYQMQVVTGDGDLLGHVQQAKSCWSPRILVANPDRTPIGLLKGPCCVCKCPCCGDIEFPMMAPDDETVIGKVSKQWTGAAREFFTDADNFSVTFPMDMDVRAKAAIFGATIMVMMAPDDETVIGKVSKQWTGAAREFFTDADNFSVTFPMDMDVCAKAAIFGATIMVDMMYFEHNN